MSDIGFRPIVHAFCERLSECQLVNGGWPTTRPQDKHSSLWTSAVVISGLTLAGGAIKEHDKAIQFMLTTNRLGTVWTDSFLKDKPSVFKTSDCIRALVNCKMLNEVIEPVKTLLSFQNSVDGGWGLTDGDAESKVRTTAYAVRALLEAYKELSLRSIIDVKKLKAGLEYLELARNSDGTWGRSTTDRTHDHTCVALALICMMLGESFGLVSAKDSIKEGVLKLRGMKEKEGRWSPMTEHLVAELKEGKYECAISDSGTPLVFTTFCLAAKLGYVRASELPLRDIITDLTLNLKNGWYNEPANGVRVWETADWLFAYPSYVEIQTVPSTPGRSPSTLTVYRLAIISLSIFCIILAIDIILTQQALEAFLLATLPGPAIIIAETILAAIVVTLLAALWRKFRKPPNGRMSGS
jgi:hypothetical protein